MEAYTRTRGRFPGCSRVRGCVLEAAQAMFSIDEIPMFTWKIARCPLRCNVICLISIARGACARAKTAVRNVERPGSGASLTVCEDQDAFLDPLSTVNCLLCLYQMW